MQSSYEPFDVYTHDELWIEVIPVLSRNESRGWILIDLTRLLEVSDASEKEHKAVQRVATKIDEVPHVSQIRANALAENLLSLLPNEAEHVNNNKKLKRSGRIATLFLQRLTHRCLHMLGAEEQHGLNFRSLTHENQDNC